MSEEPIPQTPPNAGAGDEGAEASPDLLTTLWRRFWSRRAVQLTLGYMATGYAIIRFVDNALGESARSEAIVSTGWILYWCGLFVVAFAIPLFLSGTHRYRSLLIGGVVVTSLAAGMYLRGLWIDSESPSTAPARTGPDTFTADAPGDSPVPSSASESTTTPALAETNPQVPTVPAPEPTPDVTGGGDTDPDAPATPLDRLVLLFGESDRVALDTQPTPVALFQGYEAPIPLRLYSVSGDRLRLRVGEPSNRTDATLDLDALGATASTNMLVPTLCGTLTYRVEALRTSAAAAEVTASLDRPRAEQEVDRAEALDRCRTP